MKKNKFINLILLIALMALVSCKKDEIKPLGAVDIDYEAVEKLNSDGPTLSNDNSNYAPPTLDKMEKESGPWATQANEEAFPYFEGDGTVSEDDVPIYVKEHE